MLFLADSNEGYFPAYCNEGLALGNFLEACLVIAVTAVCVVQQIGQHPLLFLEIPARPSIPQYRVGAAVTTNDLHAWRAHWKWFEIAHCGSLRSSSVPVVPAVEFLEVDLRALPQSLTELLGQSLHGAMDHRGIGFPGLSDAGDRLQRRQCQRRRMVCESYRELLSSS